MGNVSSPLLPSFGLEEILGGVNPWLILRVSTKGKICRLFEYMSSSPWVEQGPVSVMKMLDKNPVV